MTERKVMSNTGFPDDTTTAPQVVGPDPADVEAVAVSMIVATFPAHKLPVAEEVWDEFCVTAKAAIAALVERGWTKP